MHRLLVSLGVLLAGCTVGEVNGPGTGSNPGGGSNPGSGGPDGGGPAANCVNRANPTSTAHDHGGGVTHAGENCIVSGCHLPGGGGGPPYLFAGTIYQPDGTSPAVGVQIRVEGPGTPLTAFSDQAGNFKFDDNGTNPFSATTSTSASGCPATDSHMSGKLTSAATSGMCNNAGCHVHPGGTLLSIANL